MTDKELYIGISEKRNDAFLFLYRNQIDSIIRMVKQNSGLEEDALDIFQEGMIALWVNIQKGNFRLDNTTKLSTYIQTICRNLWLTKLRNIKKTVALSSYIEQGSTENHESEQDYLEINKLREHFKQLGSKCQSILNLYYFEKSSMKEIAEELKYEEKTAKNEKYRCMQKLRAMYN